MSSALQWRHNGGDSVSNHQPHDCLLNQLVWRRSKKTSKLRVTGLCVGNSPGTGEFPAQMASNAENVSIWWRHHGSPTQQQNYSNTNFPSTLNYAWSIISEKGLRLQWAIPNCVNGLLISKWHHIIIKWWNCVIFAISFPIQPGMGS